MALKSIGILIALCVSLVLAIDQSSSAEARQEQEEHGHFNPHFSHSSEKWPSQEFQQISGKWPNHGSHNSQFQHQFGAKSNSPLSSGGLNMNELFKPHTHLSIRERPSFGLNKPISHHSFQKWNYQPNINLPSSPMKEDPEGHKINHRPDSNRTPAQVKKYPYEMSRRRPLFYPIYPYPLFYPHTHHSTNDEEFVTIEALKAMNYQMSRDQHDNDSNDDNENEFQKIEGPQFHGPIAPHFPMKPEMIGENNINIPNNHGYNHPHFNPFHKEPSSHESENSFAPTIFEHPNLNGDDFPTSDEAQPYGLESSSEVNYFPFIIIGNDSGHLNISSILLDIINKFHHGHGKPHLHENKPNKVPLEDVEGDIEGSGEGDIIPLFSEDKFSVGEENDVIEQEKVKQY